MYTTEIISVIVLSVSSVTCGVSCLIVTKYLKSKALGKQTMLDKFITEFLKAFFIYNFLNNIIIHLMIFPYDLPEIFARISFYSLNFTFENAVIWSIVVVIVRYKPNF